MTRGRRTRRTKRFSPFPTWDLRATTSCAVCLWYLTFVRGSDEPIVLTIRYRRVHLHALAVRVPYLAGRLRLELALAGPGSCCVCFCVLAEFSRTRNHPRSPDGRPTRGDDEPGRKSSDVACASSSA